MSLFSRLNILHRVRSWKSNVLGVLQALEQQNQTMSSAIADLQAKLDDRFVHYEQDIESVRATLSTLDELQVQLIEMREIINSKDTTPQPNDVSTKSSPMDCVLNRLSKSSIELELRLNRIELNHRELREKLKLDRDLVAEFRKEAGRRG